MECGIHVNAMNHHNIYIYDDIKIDRLYSFTYRLVAAEMQHDHKIDTSNMNRKQTLTFTHALK